MWSAFSRAIQANVHIRNEALPSLYLTGLEKRATVLPGGYRVSGERAAPDRNVAVEKLAPANPYEQLVLRMGEREIA